MQSEWIGILMGVMWEENEDKVEVQIFSGICGYHHSADPPVERMLVSFLRLFFHADFNSPYHHWYEHGAIEMANPNDNFYVCDLGSILNKTSSTSSLFNGSGKTSVGGDHIPEQHLLFGCKPPSQSVCPFPLHVASTTMSWAKVSALVFSELGYQPGHLTSHFQLILTCSTSN